MSFIRRSDGTIVYSAGHVGSRGSLSSLVDSGRSAHNDDSDDSDDGWEETVAHSMMTYGESLCLQGAVDHDVNCLERLWEKYDGSCPDLTREFNEKYFHPAGR